MNTRTRSRRSRTTNQSPPLLAYSCKVQLYTIFVVAICWLCLLHVLGYVRLLRHHGQHDDNDNVLVAGDPWLFAPGRSEINASPRRRRINAIATPALATTTSPTSRDDEKEGEDTFQNKESRSKQFAGPITEDEPSSRMVVLAETARRPTTENAGGPVVSSSSRRRGEQQEGGSTSTSGGWGIYRLLSASLNNETNDGAAATASPPPLTKEQGPTTTKVLADTLSPPQAILFDYIRRHSVETLRREQSSSYDTFRRRRFAIAYYSCPQQLGNRIYHFMNNLLWSIITDRTILYKYLDRATCEQLMITRPMLFLDDKICRAANTEMDCDTILERAPWVPSYDEFADPSWQIHPIDFWQTHWYKVSDQWVRDRYPLLTTTNDVAAAQQHQQVGNNKHNINITKKVDQLDDKKLVDFPAWTNAETATINGRFTRQALLATSDARITARKLANLGLRYTYGMFYAELFRLRPEHVELLREYYPKAAATTMANHSNNDGEHTNDNVFSIALHSRHKHVKQKGWNIQNEKDCLNKVLINRPAHQPCRVCAMSDRPATLKTLEEWLRQEHHCQMIHIDHEVPMNSFSIEHGPNAGAGFVRELDVCHRYGTDAVVTASTGSGASSSALLEAMTDYYNRNSNNNDKAGGRHIGNNNNNNITRAETQYCNAYST